MSPLCLLRFPVGRGSSPAKSLADFGLMASLTYETPERAQPACAHYFPNWRVEKRPESARNIDWIRFLMLTSQDNSTTVIAVRGSGAVSNSCDASEVLWIFWMCCRTWPSGWCLP